MIDSAHGWEDNGRDRFAIQTRHDHAPWVVIIEPNPVTRTLLVITAYRKRSGQSWGSKPMADARSLDVSYRDGRVLAAYLTFGRESGDSTAWSDEVERGLVVDYAADARPIGLELVDPDGTTLEAVSRVLVVLGQPPATDRELAPLFGASARAG